MRCKLKEVGMSKFLDGTESKRINGVECKLDMKFWSEQVIVKGTGFVLTGTAHFNQKSHSKKEAFIFYIQKIKAFEIRVGFCTPERRNCKTSNSCKFLGKL
jgi:hypothetical protein